MALIVKLTPKLFARHWFHTLSVFEWRLYKLIERQLYIQIIKNRKILILFIIFYVFITIFNLALTLKIKEFKKKI